MPLSSRIVTWCRTTPRRSLPVLAVALTAIAFVVSACGNDDSSSGSSGSGGSGTSTQSSSASTTPEKKAAGAPIKTMTITDLNSQGPVYPNIKVAAEAYGKWINNHGGIKGRPLAVEVCDAKGDPTQATACARKAVQDKVVAVVGSFTFTGDAIVPTLEAGKTSYFGLCCALSPKEFGSKYSFLLGNQPLYGVGLVKHAVDDGCKKIGSVIIQGAEAFKVPMDNAAKALGTKFVKNIVLPATSQDYSSQVAQATSGTDCLVMIVSETPYVAWMNAYAQSPDKPRMYGPQGNLDAVSIKGNEQAADGAIIAGMFPDMSLPQWADYRQALKDANAPSDLDYNSLGGLGDWAAYSAFKQIVEGMSGEIDNETFFDAASKAKVHLPGMVPDLDFSTEWTDGLKGYTRLINHSVVFSTVKDGKIVPLTNDFEDVGDLALGKKPAQ